jgi:hypothetical protein
MNFGVDSARSRDANAVTADLALALVKALKLFAIGCIPHPTGDSAFDGGGWGVVIVRDRDAV